MKREQVDVVVIGAGPGGYHAAIRAAQLGKSVVCVDRGAVGGVCLNSGCIPTKALLHVGEVAYLARTATGLGLDVGPVAVDVDRVRAFADRAVHANVSGVEALFATNRVRFVRGDARFLARDTVAVGTASGEELVLATSHVVVATGATPVELPGWPRDGEVVIDSNDAVKLRTIPERLLVVGGGVVGLELATVYQRLGSSVTVVERLPEILPGMDREIVRTLRRILTAQGIALRTATSVVDLVVRDEARVVLEDSSGTTAPATFDQVLVAVGRRPMTRGLDLEIAGVRIDDRGFIAVDGRRATSVPGVWAVGNVTGGPLLAHKAMREGVVVAEALAGMRSAAYDPIAVPSCVYTDPELATVGLTEEQARASGARVRIGRFPLSASGRGRTMGAADGLIKLVGDEDTDLLLGVHIVAPQAESLIGEGIIALEMCATIEDLALSMHPHPTFTEAIHDAAEAAHMRAIHIANRPQRAAREAEHRPQ